MTNDDFYAKEFFFGRVSISRGEMESLPCPFCTKDVTDKQMQSIINETCENTKSRMGLSKGEAIDLLDDKTNEVWWEELEKAINSFDIPYYEDMDDDD